MLRALFVGLAQKAIARGVRPPAPRALDDFRQQARVQDLLRAMHVDVVLDVGANRGFYAQHLRRSGYRGLILSFEPIAADHARIEALAARDPAWRGFPWALGAESGEKQFNIVLTGESQGETVLSSFLPITIADAPSRIETVQIRRLDEILPDLLAHLPDPRIFLKMDTQGFDLHVVEGAGRWLDRVVMLQSELSVVPLYRGMPHYTQALESYERHGFALMDMFVVNRTATGGVLEYDCLMTRPEK